MLENNFVEKIKTYASYPIALFRKSFYSWDKVKKILLSRAGYRCQHGACVLHTGYLRLQIHTWYMYYLLLLHCNN